MIQTRFKLGYNIRKHRNEINKIVLNNGKVKRSQKNILASIKFARGFWPNIILAIIFLGRLMSRLEVKFRR